jgi:hypothetical protein
MKMEARAERTRRQELDRRVTEEMKQLRASQMATEEALRNFIKSLTRTTNGDP